MYSDGNRYYSTDFFKGGTHMNKQSSINIDAIIKDIDTATGLSKDKYLNDNHFKIISCYFLWMMKKDPSLKTPRELEDIITRNERHRFGHLPVSDLCEFYSENPDKWNNLISLLPQYTDKDLAACITESQLLDRELAWDLYRIPAGICLLIDELLEIHSGDKILEIRCGESEYILSSQERNKKASYVGYDDDYQALQMASIVADVKGLTSISFEDDFYTDGFNKVFANSFYESEGSSRNHEINSELEIAWPEFPAEASMAWKSCALALKKSGKNGRAVALVSGGQLTLKTYQNVRKILCDNGYIEGIITLADKTFETTAISPYILIFGNGNKEVKFLNAEEDFAVSRANGKRINVLTEDIVASIINKYNSKKQVTTVSIKEIAGNNYNLNPTRYTNKPDRNTKTVELGQFIKKIKRGMTLGASEMDQRISEEPSEIKCILPSDITNGVVMSNKYYNAELKKNCKNIASIEDILISKTGNPFKVAISREVCLCMGNMYIISLDSEKICPEYVRCFLASRQGKAELNRYASGSGVIIITVENLSKIRIPIYDDEIQESLNKKAKEIIKDIEKYYKQITDAKEEIDSLFE